MYHLKIRATLHRPPRWLALVWLGLCALAMTDLTRRLLGLPARPDWLDGFIFGATIFGYTVLYPSRRLRAAAWMAGAAAAVCFLRLHWTLQLATVVPGALWVAYYGPAIGRALARIRRAGGLHKPLLRVDLRAMPVAKPVTIALTWAWVTVLLPVPVHAWPAAFALFAGRACFIFALALAYDLVDLDDDRRRNLPTLAGRLGYRPSIGLLFAALSGSALCVSLNFRWQVYTLPATAALLGSLALAAAALIAIVRAPWSAGWKKIAIDGLMVMQWGLVWLLTIGW